MIDGLTDPVEIVCLATRRLNDPMPTIVQHLMRALAMRTRTLYVEPPVDPVFLARTSRWTNIRSQPDHGKLTRSVPLVLPGETRLASLASLNRHLVVRQVRRHLDGWRRADCVLWLPTPNYIWLADALPDLPLCYYVSDDYRQAPAALVGTTIEVVAGREARLLSRARWVLVNSSAMLDETRSANGNTHWVPSGVDPLHFRSDRETATIVPSDLATIPRPIAGFLGAVDGYKVDFPLLRDCARALPDVSFVTVGPVGWVGGGDRESVPTGPNVYHLGLRPYASLPAYLRGFDVALLPNRTTGYMARNFPMKLFEYFAAKLPVVSTDLPSLRPFAPWIRIAREPREFVQQVRTALRKPDARNLQEAYEVALRNSWDRQAMRVMDILHGKPPEAVLPPARSGRDNTELPR